jgi:hypothetical protein
MNVLRAIAFLLAIGATCGPASAGVFVFTGTPTVNVPVNFTTPLFFHCLVYTGAGGTLIAAGSQPLTLSGGKFSGTLVVTIDTTQTDAKQTPGYWTCEIGTSSAAQPIFADAYTWLLANASTAMVGFTMGPVGSNIHAVSGNL